MITPHPPFSAPKRKPCQIVATAKCGRGRFCKLETGHHLKWIRLVNPLGHKRIHKDGTIHVGPAFLAVYAELGSWIFLEKANFTLLSHKFSEPLHHWYRFEDEPEWEFARLDRAGVVEPGVPLLKGPDLAATSDDGDW